MDYAVENRDKKTVDIMVSSLEDRAAAAKAIQTAWNYLGRSSVRAEDKQRHRQALRELLVSVYIGGDTHLAEGETEETFPAWPKIRDLPEEERAPFTKWLSGPQPYLFGDNLQDAYYPWNYDVWRQGQEKE